VHLNIKKVTNKLGNLFFIEGGRDIPFEIKRIYYITDVPGGEVRGHHAHKSLQQILIAIKGKIIITLDNGKKEKKVLLDSPEKALYIPGGVWRTMQWLDSDSILLVLASDYYDENDYIRDYEIFRKMVDEGFWNGSFI